MQVQLVDDGESNYSPRKYRADRKIGASLAFRNTPDPVCLREHGHTCIIVYTTPDMFARDK